MIAAVDGATRPTFNPRVRRLNHSTAQTLKPLFPNSCQFVKFVDKEHLNISPLFPIPYSLFLIPYSFSPSTSHTAREL